MSSDESEARIDRSDECEACWGTGLRKLFGSSFAQDCPYCGGTGVKQ